jgi:hypothetical protein
MIEQETFVDELLADNLRTETYEFLKEVLITNTCYLDNMKLPELKEFSVLYSRQSEHDQQLVRSVIKLAIEESISHFLWLIDKGVERRTLGKAKLILKWRAKDGTETTLGGDDEDPELTYLQDLFGAARNDQWVLDANR